jgi:hypothetical protein
VAASPPDPAACVVRLGRGRAVEGTIVRPDGTPAAGATVRVEGSASLVARAGPDGAFRIEAVDAGACTLAVQCSGFPDAADGPFDVPSAPRVIRLQAGGRISGVVRTIDGPAVHAQIRVSRDGRTWGLGAGADGRFALDGLASGTYQVAHEDGITNFSRQVVVTAPETTDVRLVPDGSATLTGTVTKDHRPAEGFVHLRPKTEGLPTRGARLVNGRFELRGVEPGSYFLSARYGIDPAEGIGEPVELHDGRTTNVDLRPPD